MNDLLFAGSIFDQYLYFVTDKTLNQIALETNVSPTNIIADNHLTCAPSRGDVLVIKKRGALKILQPNDLKDVKYIEELKLKNQCDCLHVFQLVNV